jgi:hypothetical protein
MLYFIFIPVWKWYTIGPTIGAPTWELIRKRLYLHQVNIQIFELISIYKIIIKIDSILFIKKIRYKYGMSRYRSASASFINGNCSAYIHGSLIVWSKCQEWIENLGKNMPNCTHLQMLLIKEKKSRRVFTYLKNNSGSGLYP